jgi:hypothetical protein
MEATLIMVARTDSFWNMREMTAMTMGIKQPRPRPKMQRVTMSISQDMLAPKIAGRPPMNTKPVASIVQAL